MSTEITFEKDADGNYIGYHVECISSCKANETELLCLENLLNDKPLFLSDNPRHWWPFHLNRPDDYRLLKVVFSNAIKHKVFTKEGEYTRLFHMIAYKRKPELYNFKFKPAGKKLLEEGVRFFVLNPDKELQEAFLVNPKEHVLSIELLDAPKGVVIPGLPGSALVEDKEGVTA